MICYSVRPKNHIFVKGYGFLSFAKIMCKKISWNVSEGWSSKYNQKLLDHAKQSVTDAFKSVIRRNS